MNAAGITPSDFCIRILEGQTIWRKKPDLILSRRDTYLAAWIVLAAQKSRAEFEITMKINYFHAENDVQGMEIWQSIERASKELLRMEIQPVYH